MSALLSFERFVQGLVEGSIFRLLRGRIEPVEIAKRLAHTMEGQQTVSVGRIVVPNRYRVRLNPDDFESLKPIAGSLRHELAVYLAGLAHERNFSFAGAPAVALEADPAVGPKSVQIDAELAEDVPGHSARSQAAEELAEPKPPDRTQVMRPVRPAADPAAPPGTAYLVRVDPAGAGWRHKLEPVTRIGRGLDNELILEDRTVSRHHAEVRLEGSTYQLVDLNSTNGVTVNGRRVRNYPLRAGDRVRFGTVEFLFDPSAD